MELKGKKLLLMGGSNNINDILAYQKRTGIIIVVSTDTNHLESALRGIAQETYDVSPFDVDGLIKLVKEKHIDGIFGGGNEDIISCAIDVAEACGLPFYVSRAQWDITANKKRFKEACRAYNIPVVEEYTLTDDLSQENVSAILFPVVMKPVDACGSRGVTLCRNVDELFAAYPAVKCASKSGNVIVERYERGTEIAAYYSLCDGEITLSSIVDKYSRVSDKSINPLSDAYAYPSRYTNLYIEKYNDAMLAMLKGIGLKNGLLGIQGFACDGIIRFFEMGYRLGGTSQYRYTKAINGLSNFDMLMTYSLTGRTEGFDQSLDNPKFTKPCCTLTLLARAGKVERICGVDIVNAMEGVLTTEVHFKCGDTVFETNTLAQMFFWVFIVCDSVAALKNTINAVQDTLAVYDTNGDSMIINRFDPNRLDYGDACFQ